MVALLYFAVLELAGLDAVWAAALVAARCGFAGRDAPAGYAVDVATLVVEARYRAARLQRGFDALSWVVRRERRGVECQVFGCQMVCWWGLRGIDWHPRIGEALPL